MFSQPLYPVHLGVLVSGLLGPRGTGHLPLHPVSWPWHQVTEPAHPLGCPRLFVSWSLGKDAGPLFGGGERGVRFSFLFKLAGKLLPAPHVQAAHSV